MTPSSYMFKQLSWLSIPKRLMYNKAVFAYKALNNLTTAYISNLWRPISKTHSRSLRSTDYGLLSKPRSRSALFDRSFSHSKNLWNALPQNIRTASSLNEFYVLCTSVYMCFVVTCWERADLLALVCGVFCEFVTFPLVSWVRCGT